MERELGYYWVKWSAIKDVDEEHNWTIGYWNGATWEIHGFQELRDSALFGINEKRLLWNS